VHHHIVNIHNKLDVSSRAAAVAYCLQHNGQSKTKTNDVE
jgi:DNA-binding NarL/FixJ family response regulator